MFVAKIYHEKTLLHVAHYKKFRNALAAIGNKNIFEEISDELLNSLGNPDIRPYSHDDIKGIADDFEFRYSNGVRVYVGEIIPSDAAK